MSTELSLDTTFDYSADLEDKYSDVYKAAVSDIENLLADSFDSAAASNGLTVDEILITFSKTTSSRLSTNTATCSVFVSFSGVIDSNAEISAVETGVFSSVSTEATTAIQNGDGSLFSENVEVKVSVSVEIEGVTTSKTTTTTSDSGFKSFINKNEFKLFKFSKVHHGSEIINNIS